jgi:S1-C subfamily serine protease
LLDPVLPKEGKTRPIMLKKVISVVPRGKVIGTMRTGGLLPYSGPLCWKSDKTTMSDVEMGDLLREQLQKCGYTVVGDPEALFEDRSGDRAEFLIGGKIRDIDADISYPRSGSGDWVTAKGDVFVEVEWELYSKRTRDVVLRMTTRGSSSSGGRAESFQDIFSRAFDAAARNLLAQEKLYQLVSLERELPSIAMSPAKPAEIRVQYRTVADVAKRNMEREKVIGTMRSSVVTIFSGSGHGSGFLISADGYVLTNEHVVGEAAFVNVKFVTGKEVAGQVIKVNKVRDVALVKLEADNYPSLVLGDTSVINIGDEVFSIGTPLSADLSQTVTRGIVSSIRIKDDIKYVQSDVNIHPGNSGGPLVSLNNGVVGICVSGITFGPYTLGLNYFIPIEEAVKALGIVKTHA